MNNQKLETTILRVDKWREALKKEVEKDDKIKLKAGEKVSDASHETRLK